MIASIGSYWKYLVRPLPADTYVPSGIEIVPHFFMHTVYYTLCFILIMGCIPTLGSWMFPRWYCDLNPRKRSELPSYLGSMIHHFSVVPLAWYYICKDFQLLDNDSLDYSDFLWLAAPLCTGFILADTLFYAIPLSFHGNFEYILHHALAIWLIYIFLYGPGEFTRFYPHIIICDTTNILFNTAWLLRLVGLRDSSIVARLEVLFALCFVAIRGINLSLVFGLIFLSEKAQAFGNGRFVLPLISALQFYWLRKIVLSLATKFFPSNDNKKKL